MTTPTPVTLTTKAGKISLLPADLKKLSPQVAHALQQAVAVNKQLHINTKTPVQISGFTGFYDVNNTVYSSNKKLQISKKEDPSLTPSNNTSANIKFNLPPHAWSLPINQGLLSTGNASRTDPNLRRARMWCYVGADNSGYTSLTGAGSANTTTSTGSTGSTVAATLDTNWGFQFLWNPTQIGTSVQRNANLVPQALDAFAGRAPLFPGTEALSFVAVINRVNDFACAKGIIGGRYNGGTFESNLAINSYEILKTFYSGGPVGPTQDVVLLVTDLLSKGTMADIEYIFKMINGDGVNGYTWKNALGRKTADINFLAPTPIAVQFGPNDDSLSYVGWVESISISHQMFTEDMIPIHSEVTINMSTYSQSSLSNS